MKFLILPFLAALLVLSGCATQPTRDLTEFRRHQPKSIVVLPPLNESTDINASVSVYTTVTRPLAELGYYVFPIGLVDTFLKENGCPTPNEMHQVAPHKLREVFGADAVLYITVQKYGSKYVVIANTTIVQAKAKLVDTLTGTELWQGRVEFVQGGNSGLIEALVGQVINKLTDQAHTVAFQASYLLLTSPDRGIPLGPRHPKFFEERPSDTLAQPQPQPQPQPKPKTEPVPPLRFK